MHARTVRLHAHARAHADMCGCILVGARWTLQGSRCARDHTASVARIACDRQGEKIRWQDEKVRCSRLLRAPHPVAATTAIAESPFQSSELKSRHSSWLHICPSCASAFEAPVSALCFSQGSLSCQSRHGQGRLISDTPHQRHAYGPLQRLSSLLYFLSRAGSYFYAVELVLKISPCQSLSLPAL
eukprot:6205295-Pleurochrysis_carterae.AAC.1